MKEGRHREAKEERKRRKAQDRKRRYEEKMASMKIKDEIKKRKGFEWYHKNDCQSPTEL
jgi:hypothetical protein